MDALLRRRAMIAQGGTPPTPPPSPSLIYSIESSVTTQNYDTDVKLFDEPKSFTILCVATFNDYNWTARTEGVYGISTGAYFRVGSVSSGQEYVSGEASTTGNRYIAVMMNNASGDKKCVSIGSRVNGNQTMRFAVTYDHTTRMIYAQASDNKTHWYIVPGDLSSNNTLKFLIGGASGTISTFEIYNGVLDGTTIDNFIAGN